MFQSVGDSKFEFKIIYLIANQIIVLKGKVDMNSPFTKQTPRVQASGLPFLQAN